MSRSTAPGSANAGAVGGDGTRLSNRRLAAAAAALAGYALLAHGLMLNPALRPWAAGVVFGPLLAALAVAGWRGHNAGLLAACAAGAGLLVLVVAHGDDADLNRLYVLQHAGIHAALGLAFGLSLRRGATPLVSALAQGVHQRLGLRFDAEVAAYTRGVTRLWSVYFAAMIGLSLLVYTLAPWPWWSAFGNLATPLSAAALMVGEHLHRYRRHPHFDRVTLRAAIAAFAGAGRR